MNSFSLMQKVLLLEFNNCGRWPMLFNDYRLLDWELHEGNQPVLPTIVILVLSIISGRMLEFTEHMKYCGPGLHKY